MGKSDVVRNDSGQPLQDVRLVVTRLSKCQWREAQTALPLVASGGAAR